MGDVFYVISALFGTIFLFLGVIYGMKILQKRYQISTNLKLKENLFLDTKRRACVLSYGEQEYLLILGTQGEHIFPLNQNASMTQHATMLHTPPTEDSAFAQKAA